MSSVDWEEVKRLAADFQRAQLSSTVQRLSERNCIEIITYLIERKRIDVVYTTDGKEYITPQHLIKEIKDELYIHGGRINLVELAKILQVNLTIITARAQEIERTDNTVKIINGQLIDQNYVTSLSEEINEKLGQQGQITVGDLTSQYDLPGDYLLTIIERQLGKIIKGKQDKQDRHVFFTEAFVQKNISIIRGALLAVTKPTPVSALLHICGAQEKLFYSVVDVLSEAKELPGVVTGKQGANSIFVPTIYSKSQVEWVTNFFKQNGYLEFSAMTRLGISDPLSFVKKHVSGGNMHVLDSCVVGPVIVDQVDSAVDEVIASGTLVNILPLLPSSLEEKDAEMILHQAMKRKSTSQLLHIFDSTIVTSETFLRGLVKLFDKLVEQKAEHCVLSGTYLKKVLEKTQSSKNMIDVEEKGKVDKKEERRRKAAEGKGGGGTQGRETKTKSTKKKYMKGKQNEDSDEDEVVTKSSKNNDRLELVLLSEIRPVLESVQLLADEDSEALVEEVARYLYPGLNKTALETAQRLHESTISSVNQSRRKKHTELQEKLNDLVMNIRLFDKGLKQFPAKDTQQQLSKYLLKSVCTDVANEVFRYVAQENSALKEGQELTAEMRGKIVNEVSGEAKETLLKLNKSLTVSSLDDFLAVIEAAVGPGLCDIILKKPDKKRERPQLLNHRQQLIEQLNVSTDAALVLHLCCLIIFQGVTQCMLHASGRFVSTILTFLQSQIPVQDFNTLQKYHDLVLKLLTTSDADEKSRTESELQEELPAIKEIALSFKKTDKNRLPSE